MHHGQEAEPELAELKMRFLWGGGQHSWNHESEHPRGQYGSNVLEMKPDSDGLDMSKRGMVNIAAHGCLNWPKGRFMDALRENMKSVSDGEEGPDGRDA